MADHNPIHDETHTLVDNFKAHPKHGDILLATRDTEVYHQPPLEIATGRAHRAERIVKRGDVLFVFTAVVIKGVEMVRVSERGWVRKAGNFAKMQMKINLRGVARVIPRPGYSSHNVRKGPGTQHEAIHPVNSGDIIPVFKMQGDWCMIGPKKWTAFRWNGVECLEWINVKDNLCMGIMRVVPRRGYAQHNVRNAPTTSGSRVLDQIDSEDIVQVYEIRGGWARIGPDRWSAYDWNGVRCMEWVARYGDQGLGTMRVVPRRGYGYHNIRDAPTTQGSNIAGVLDSGDVVQVYEVRAVGGDKWARIGPSTWSAVLWQGITCMEWRDQY